VGLATISAAASTNLVWFTLSLMVMAQSKAMFDVGLGAWISDRVGFDRRGRVMALTETAWAVGLLLGVTAMGLVTAASNWRVGYVLGALSVLGLAAAVRALLPVDTAAVAHARRTAARSGRMPRSGWVLVGGVFCLMFATQCLFVTFGSWLKDHFGLTDTGVSMVVFGLGFGELFASLSSARFVDHWGKERSTIIGAGIMVPSALVLAVGHGHLLPGLVALVIAIGAFEFAVVCVFPITTEMIPGAPARGIALTFAFGTMGRAAASVTATRLYTKYGMVWPALLCAAFAVGTMAAIAWFQRQGGERSHAVAH
jgi:predicted MFS family arabinose efflux permease